MAERTLNAVVTLRNEISPWLMILQVAPDGWNLPNCVPGQFAVLGLFGSASRCALAEPEDQALANVSDLQGVGGKHAEGKVPVHDLKTSVARQPL